MKRIAVMTDSNSGITQLQAKELGITVLPMPFYIDGKLYFEDISLTQEQFYEQLKNDADINTSQPTPSDVTDTWNKLLGEYDEVVHIPMSSGLSGSCATAISLAADYDGRVQVVDNRRISVTQRQSVLDAVELAEAGESAASIKEILEREKARSNIYLTLETLKYLKKGGRITPAAAAIGTVLSLKPVLQINGDKPDAYAKVRGKAAAKETMLKVMDEQLATKYKGIPISDIHLAVAYSGNLDEAAEWKKKVEEHYGVSVDCDPLSLSVACHIGYGAVGIACSQKI